MLLSYVLQLYTFMCEERAKRFESCHVVNPKNKIKFEEIKNKKSDGGETALHGVKAEKCRKCKTSEIKVLLCPLVSRYFIYHTQSTNFLPSHMHTHTNIR
jgi:hypothetical protein